MIRPLLLALLLAGLAVPGRAIDINPSKETVPRDAWDTGGNRFSIFNGDPKRIQRANEVDPKAFDAKLTVSPTPFSLKSLLAIGPNPSFKVIFTIHNHGKKTYTLSFPTAQRWDFRILDRAGQVIYSYTADHEFVQSVGTSMIDADEKLVYVESLAFDDLTGRLVPGVYKIEAMMANYPEIKSEAEITISE